MFKRIRLRIQDMRTLSRLISGADEQAHRNGEDEPGAEHYLLSALMLPDGTARRAFERIGADPDTFQTAITEQYKDALSAIGIDAKILDDDPDPVIRRRAPHTSQPSGQAVMKELYALKSKDKDRPLLGAHVVEVVARMKHGVVSRSLESMGIDLDAMYGAARDEIDSSYG